MRDGPLRRAVKRALLLRYTFDLAATRRILRWRGQRPWDLGGRCEGCARCCEAPAMQMGHLTFWVPLFRRLFLWWQRVVNGFVLVSREASSRTFVFHCTHFDAAARRCDSYDSRPGMCRDYPRALLWQARPEMFEGCGYRPVAPNAESLVRELQRRALTPEQQARLRKELFLER